MNKRSRSITMGKYLPKTTVGKYYIFTANSIGKTARKYITHSLILVNFNLAHKLLYCKYELVSSKNSIA